MISLIVVSLLFVITYVVHTSFRNIKKGMERLVDTTSTRSSGALAFDVVYINVDGHTQRNDSCVEQIQQIDKEHVKSVKRFSAITPSDVSVDEGAPVDAEHCCSLSQLQVWKDARDAGGWTLVLEDDVIIFKDVNKAIRQIESVAVLDRPQIFFLGYTTPVSTEISRDTELFQTSYSQMGAYGYLINDRAADILISNRVGDTSPVDVYMGKVIIERDIDSFKVVYKTDADTPVYYCSNAGGVIKTRNITSTINGKERLNRFLVHIPTINNAFYKFFIDPFQPYILKQIQTRL